MSTIAYTVSAVFDSAELANEWLHWLQAGHIAEVLAAGAVDAEIIALDGPRPAFEVRYHFPSRQAFAHYETKHAPRLRAEGLQRFPPEKGITYQRSLGSVVAVFPGAT
jgi:Domain of unknown function (DUF4286)